MVKAWLKKSFYSLYYFRKNVKFQANVLLNTKNFFEGNNTIGKDSEIATCMVGEGTYVAANSVIKHAIIGRYCSIGSNVQVGLGTHPSRIFVSTHPSFFSTAKQAGFSFVEKDLFNEQPFIDAENKYLAEIGNDVWIGNNVIITDGLKIGDGAIIAAGAVVTKNVLPYSIVGGVPARHLRYRFSESQIQKLLDIKWWNWGFKEIKLKSSLFTDIETFLAATHL